MHDKFYYDTTIDTAIQKAMSNSKTQFAWVLSPEVDYTDFDFRFVPNKFEQDQAHAWPSHNNPTAFTTWLVPKHSYEHVNYHSEMLPTIKAEPYIVNWPSFLDMGMTDIEMTGDSWNDSLCNWILSQDCLMTEWVWICDERIDYTGFDFSWRPSYFDQTYIHCFTMAGKEQLSYTWLVNRESLWHREYKFIKSNLRFNKTAVDTVVLDMGFNNNSFGYYQKKLRFIGTMEAMLHSAVKRATSEWLYVISTCCDYMMFDFGWLPDLDQIDQTHCWPSNDQQKGDTFLIHVPSYLKTMEFKFNFDHDSVHRVPWPARVYKEDSLAAAMNNHDRSASIYVVYYKQDSVIKKFPSPCLWDKRPVVGMSECNSVSLVPRDCVVKEEIYEYPYLERNTMYAHPCSLDVVFIHNGEKDAGNNLNRCNIWIPPGSYFKISSGVNGRLKAYQAAADMSNSEWFLAVFAKCHMKESFRDFKWRPDYWQKPKHYIFHNHNVDLDLTYGHMAPIAYNKRLMLENTGGLDMTLAQEHAVVPVVLSETRLTDPWDTWRTAFRETVKLMYYAKEDNSIELQYRLDRWLNADEMWAKHNPWYQYGANDGKDFFESVDGEWGWIMVTNEWDWLRKRFDALYSKSQPLQL